MYGSKTNRASSHVSAEVERNAGPLADIRIIAVEQYGAGPWATLQLSDLGAEVIKIEDPLTDGDVGRYVPPFQEGEDSQFFQAFNRGKHSLSLDLRAGAGREVLEDLVAVSDVVFSNLRGDVPEKLGLTYRHLSHWNPAIVACSLSAYGMTGPRAADPGYDYVLQGLAGWMSITGEPDAPPTKTGLSLVDFAGGYVAAISILAAVHRARITGVGSDCDVSLFDTAVSLLTYLGAWSASSGYQPVRMARSSHPSIFPFQIFPTANGWIVIACPKPKFWDRLVHALDLQQLVEDPRAATFSSRMRHAAELGAIIEEVLQTRETARWVDILSAAGVPCGPVNTIPQALADAQTVARGMIVEVESPTLGRLRVPASAVRVGSATPSPRPAPARGGSANTILAGLLGYDSARYDELARQGAFGLRQS